MTPEPAPAPVGTPRAAGLRMPAEWAPHERTIMCWPARRELWGERYEQAVADYVAVADHLVEEVARGHALAHEAALHVRQAQQHRVDGAFRRRRAQPVERQGGGGRGVHGAGTYPLEPRGVAGILSRPPLAGPPPAV